MTTVFIAGSISIKRLHPLFLERLDTIVGSGFDVVVGDADGADRSIQQALLERGATHVTVYCSGEKPRNNVGAWHVETVSSSRNPGSRAFFTAKDVEMAKVADYGLMIWDTKSTGTLSNVIELLKRERSTRVFVNKEQQFITASNAEGLKRLVDMMSEGARAKADDKIALSATLAAIAHQQFDLTLQDAQPPWRIEVETPAPSPVLAVAEGPSQSYQPITSPEVVTQPPRDEDPVGRPDRASQSRRFGIGHGDGMPRSAKALAIVVLLLIALGTILWLRG